MTRRLFLLALCGYIGVLALAAWPTPLRPAFLERPRGIALKLLAIPGWRAGQDVFTVPRVVTEAPRSFCTHAKAFGPAGDELVLRPESGHCRWEGFRWHTPALDIAETKFFYGLRRSRKRIEGTPEEHHYLAVLGRFQCREARARDFEAAHVRLLQYAVMGSYADGSTRIKPLSQFEWDCRREASRRISYYPGREQMQAFWGSGSPWR